MLRGDGPGTLFKWQSGKFLTRAVFVDKLRSALTAAGYSAEKYAGHSFTTAAQCGMEDSLIKTLGRWESSAYTRYIRTPQATLQAVSRRLVSCNNYWNDGFLTAQPTYILCRAVVVYLLTYLLFDGMLSVTGYT